MNCKVDTKVRTIPPAKPGWSLMMFESWPAFQAVWYRINTLNGPDGRERQGCWVSTALRLHPRLEPLLPGLGPRSPAELGRHWSARRDRDHDKFAYKLPTEGGKSFDSVAKLQNARSSEEERRVSPRRRCTEARAIEGGMWTRRRPRMLTATRDFSWQFLVVPLCRNSRSSKKTSHNGAAGPFHKRWREFRGESAEGELGPCRCRTRQRKWSGIKKGHT